MEGRNNKQRREGGSRPEGAANISHRAELVGLTVSRNQAVLLTASVVVLSVTSKSLVRVNLYQERVAARSLTSQAVSS